MTPKLSMNRRLYRLAWLAAVTLILTFAPVPGHWANTAHAQTLTAVFLRDDATGGDCATVGVWDGTSRTCTLSQDIPGNVVVADDGITLDGAGHRISGASVGVIMSDRQDVTVQNLVIGDTQTGIFVRRSVRIHLLDNEIAANSRGIVLDETSDSLVEGNIAQGDDYGIHLDDSPDNRVAENQASGVRAGIFLYRSPNCVLDANVTERGRNGIDVDRSEGVRLSGNRALNHRDLSISVGLSPNAVVVDNFAESQFLGISVGRSPGSLVQGNVIDSPDGSVGISLSRSDDSVVRGNSVTSTNGSNNFGIRIGGAVRVLATNNSVTGKQAGLLLTSAQEVTIQDNILRGNRIGVHLSGASGNLIEQNIIEESSMFGIALLIQSNGNVVRGNQLNRNRDGVWISNNANDNAVYNNNFIATLSRQALVENSTGNLFNLPAPVGGNYYDNYDEPAEGCTDANADRFCDAANVFSGGQDNLPWTRPDAWLNQPPNCDLAAPSVSELWPPNHQMTPVTISGVTDPDGDAIAISITSIFQDEPVNDAGDGDTAPDGAGIGTSTAEVRAERAGGGNGRFYHISFTADDGHGGSCAGAVQVSVPASQGKKGAAVDDGPLYDSTTAIVDSASRMQMELETLDWLFLPVVSGQ